MDPVSSFSGLASGFNFRDLVDAIIEVESRPVVRAQSSRSAAEARKSAIDSYRGLLSTLRTALTKLRGGDAFDALSSTVVGEAPGGRPILRATAGTGGVPGSFQVEVLSLAAAEKLGSLGQNDAAAPLGLSGVVSLNGGEVTVAVEDSLQGIRDKINTLAAGNADVAVSASILSVAPGDQRLILSSTKSGAAGIAVQDVSGTVAGTLGLLDPSAVLTDGSDAQLVIDGVTLTRDTNVIADAVEGLTLTLETAAPGTTATITVSRFKGEASGAVNEFVAAYNAVVNFISTQQINGPLQADATLRTNRGDLSRNILGILTGSGGGPVGGSEIGLSLTRTGTLALDAAAFDTALNERFPDVVGLFADSLSGADLETSLDDLLRSGTGVLDTKNSGITEQVSSLEIRIDRLQGRLDRRREALLRQFTRMESAIARLQSQSTFLQAQIPGLGGGS